MEKEVKKEDVSAEKKSNKGLVITLIVLASLLLVGLIVCLVIMFLNKQPKPVVDDTKITITFDSDGGLEVDKITFKKGTTVELPTSTKDGFEFGGWLNGEKEFTKEDTPKLEKDVLLKAKWNELTSEESLMTINFDSKGGNKVSSIQVKCINNSTEIKDLPTPKREGYNFMSWADKNGTPILNGANLICDEKLDLYANWEKKEEKQKTAKCPSGYAMNQDGTKCVQTASANESCDSGWILKNGKCYNPKSPNISGTRTCKTEYYMGDYRSGTYIQQNGSPAYCGYMELTSYIGQRDNCKNNGGSYAPNDHCYRLLKMNNYDQTCASDEERLEAQALGGGSNPGCYQYKVTNKICPAGYSNNTGYGDCAKLVDPTYE